MSRVAACVSLCKRCTGGGNRLVTGMEGTYQSNTSESQSAKQGNRQFRSGRPFSHRLVETRFLTKAIGTKSAEIVSGKLAAVLGRHGLSSTLGNRAWPRLIYPLSLFSLSLPVCRAYFQSGPPSNVDSPRENRAKDEREK